MLIVCVVIVGFTHTEHCKTIAAKVFLVMSYCGFSATRPMRLSLGVVVLKRGSIKSRTDATVFSLIRSDE